MKRKNILAIFIIIGILSSILLSFNRIKVESGNKSIDFVLNYEDIEELADQSEEDLDWWLKKFKGLGVSSVSLTEDSFIRLLEDENPLKMKIVKTIKEDIYWEEKYSEELVDYLKQDSVDKYDLVVTIKDKELYTRIKKGLEERYDTKKYKIIDTENEYTFILDGTAEEALYSRESTLTDSKDNGQSRNKILSDSKLSTLGIGYNEEKVKIIKDAGMNIVLRPINNVENWTGKKYIKSSLDQYSKFNIKPEYMVFAGGEILGYPDNIDMVQKFIQENNMSVGLIESPVQREHVNQKGLEELTKSLGYNAVRVFSVPDFIQERFKYYNYEGAEEIENTLYRAVTERNIRLIYFKPFKLDRAEYVTDYEEYEKTFKSFENRISEHNMTIGRASVMKTNTVNLILKIFIGIATLIGAIFLIEQILKIKEKFLNMKLAIGSLAIIALSIIVPNFSSTIFAIGAAIVFPSLSMIYFCKKCRKYYEIGYKDKEIKSTIVTGVKELIIMILISFIGSIFVATLLSDTEYLLEMRIFRGVKLVQVMPIVVYMITFIGCFGYKNELGTADCKINLNQIKEMMKDNIKIIYALLAGVIFYIGYIYLARTGHESNVKPSDLEMMGRNLLEVKLIARPRIKEFLLAFPAIILAINLAFNKNKLGIFVAGLLIALGQTSVVNTFSHLRTPMYLSAMRLVYGVLLGIVFGVIYLLLMKVGTKIFRLLRGEIFNE